jgi:hypothetical protein
MKPSDLTPENFAAWAPRAKAFAVDHLPLLRKLPLALCPSFLSQIRDLDTSFPAECSTLEHQCESLERMPVTEFDALMKPFFALALSDTLQARHWLSEPTAFVAALTAVLWTSGQIDSFRRASSDLFAAMPKATEKDPRLVIVVLGKDAPVQPERVLRKLRPGGVFLDGLRKEDAWVQITHVLGSHAKTSSPYKAWYIDGGDPRQEIVNSIAELHGTSFSYPGLDPVRKRVLERMETQLQNGRSGAEAMRASLEKLSLEEVGADGLSADPILARFFKELFTEGSGTQVFSTSFVQRAGRELARRAHPQIMLLRYASRQTYRDLNELFVPAGLGTPDPLGSLRDAEMNAYYNWLEMSRISVGGTLTFFVWVEETSLGVLLSGNAAAGTTCSTSLSINEAFENFA